MMPCLMQLPIFWLLGAPRGSIKKLVRDEQLSISAGAFPGFPGNKYPNLFIFYSFPAQERTNAENEEAILAEIEKLKTESVSEAELKKVKTQSKGEFNSCARIQQRHGTPVMYIRISHGRLAGTVQVT